MKPWEEHQSFWERIAQQYAEKDSFEDHVISCVIYDFLWDAGTPDNSFENGKAMFTDLNDYLSWLKLTMIKKNDFISEVRKQYRKHHNFFVDIDVDEINDVSNEFYREYVVGNVF